MDQGRPLDKSPPGPWTTHLRANATPLPILQYHPKMAFRTTSNRLSPDENASAQVQQSTAVLPLQYDSLIALVDLARRAPQDPLSMCIPLFAHAAFSEIQFLNLIESRIQLQTKAITEAVPADVLKTLQYFLDILGRHAHQLKDATRALRRLAERGCSSTATNRMEIAMPNNGMGVRSPSQESDLGGTHSSAGSDNAFTSQGLLEDYDHLQSRCLDLSNMCVRGMTLAMNKATIDESRKAIEQSGRLKRLTLLATLFIPLSFSSSVFGMNIDLLGQNAVRFWWFFVLCVPVTLLTYALYLWDLQVLRAWWAKSTKWRQKGAPDATDAKDKYRTSQIV